jgi:hypothetical protein
MSKPRIFAVAVAVVVAVGTSAIALAAVSHPTLISPTGKVAPGRIRLIVKDTAASSTNPVYYQIEPTRAVNGNGALKPCTNPAKGCFVATMTPESGRHGYWVYTPPASYTIIKGWWSVTAGRYYWQARHVDCHFKACEDLSAIGTFTVK